MCRGLHSDKYILYVPAEILEVARRNNKYEQMLIASNVIQALLEFSLYVLLTLIIIFICTCKTKTTISLDCAAAELIIWFLMMRISRC